MSIGARIDEAIEKLSFGDMENALIQISIGIDATSKKKFSKEKKVGQRIKHFVMEHEDYIMHFQTDGRLKISAENGISYGDKGTLGEVVYKSIRCALLHDAGISREIIFLTGPVFGIEDGKFIVTDNLLWGLVLILIGESVNSKESLKIPRRIRKNGVDLELDKLWGKVDAIKEAIGYVPINGLIQSTSN